jgi:hypothetical protein
MELKSKIPRLPPLSLVLIVPYVLQIISVAGFVSWLSYQSGQENMKIWHLRYRIRQASLAGGDRVFGEGLCNTNRAE